MADVQQEVWANDDGLEYEPCEFCGTKTSWWWGNGCMPLCPDCAKQMTNAQAYDLAAKEGFGPLPERTPGHLPSSPV